MFHLFILVSHSPPCVLHCINLSFLTKYETNTHGIIKNEKAQTVSVVQAYLSLTSVSKYL